MGEAQDRFPTGYNFFLFIYLYTDIANEVKDPPHTLLLPNANDQAGRGEKSKEGCEV